MVSPWARDQVCEELREKIGVFFLELGLVARMHVICSLDAVSAEWNLLGVQQ